MTDHDRKVARIAAELRAHVGKGRVSFRKRAVSHVVPKRGDTSTAGDPIDVSDLDRILSIDREAMTCTAEAGVTFVDLVRATLPLGLSPIIVPELETITIGGAVAGCSLESKSFVHGGFHDTCLEYEIVTAQGEVIVARPEGEHALHFQMMHGTFGTLGLLTKLVFRVEPAKPWVKVVYERHSTLASYRAAIERRVASRDVDFMDGILHAPGSYVLSLGTFVDDAPYHHRYDWTRVYWKSTLERAEDYLPTEAYYFRYDHGVTNTHPKSVLGRLVLGKFLHSSQLLRLARLARPILPAVRPRITVDLFLPMARVEEFLEWYDGVIGHYPLWCVPYARVRDYEWIAEGHLAGVEDRLFLDLAIYGAKQPRGRNQYEEIEQELLRVHGLKTLISYNYYDEETFWRIWNRPNYEAVKRVTDPEGAFGDLYVKTCLASRGAALRG